MDKKKHSIVVSLWNRKPAAFLGREFIRSVDGRSISNKDYPGITRSFDY